MKGLELSEKYFFEACLPILRRELPHCLDKIAVGLVGEGSDCFGWDDELSRDHSWGPRLCLWLSRQDLMRFESELSCVIKLFPDSFEGFSVQPPLPQEGKRSGLFEVGKFYTMLIGRAGAPETPDDWMATDEVRLAAASNGKVFWDPAGDFTAIRNDLLAYYPEDVRLRHLAQYAAVAAQTGQYNLSRCRMRGDAMASYVAKSKFVESVAAMTFLLNRRYRPFYKWTFHAMSALPLVSGKVYPLLEELVASARAETEQRLVERIAAVILEELRHQDLTASGSNFLMDHCGALLSRIEDSHLSSAPISLLL
ncbi:MAG: DUF4037 domain-containing protein [Oscillospiraceae bacterium]